MKDTVFLFFLLGYSEARYQSPPLFWAWGRSHRDGSQRGEVLSSDPIQLALTDRLIRLIHVTALHDCVTQSL